MKASQNSRILSYLMKGNQLTPLLALNLFDTWRLSARISNLRSDGFPIITKTVTKGGKSFASYSLNHKESLGI